MYRSIAIYHLKKLGTNSPLLSQYNGTFNEQHSRGIVEEVQMGTNDGVIHYLPHQPVINPSKTTTKLRIVFDASCKTQKGTSLNDHLYRGPLPNLTGLLIRFRTSPIPLLADAEKAFLQLELHIKDRDCTVSYGSVNLSCLKKEPVSLCIDSPERCSG